PLVPRALARSAYGASRRIGEAGISIARLESLTLLNVISLTFRSTPYVSCPTRRISGVKNTRHWIAVEKAKIVASPSRISTHRLLPACKETRRSTLCLPRLLLDFPDRLREQSAALRALRYFGKNAPTPGRSCGA